MTKVELRKNIKASLEKLDPVEKAFESMSKCTAIVQSEIFRKAKCIFAFMPMKDEVDVLPILREGLNQGKKILVPKIIEKTNDMDFYFLTDEPNYQTEEGSFGIYEPKTELNKCKLDEFLRDTKINEILVFVPGLAFGKDNSRLGRGKGFYDKFLSKLKNKAPSFTKIYICGICYDVQLVDFVPMDENDVKVDFVI